MSGMETAVLGGLASGAGTAIAGRVLGGSTPRVRNSLPREVNLPGLQLTRGSGGFNVTRTDDAQNLLGEIRRLGERRAGEIRSMADEVRPGFGRLTEARTEALGSARRRTIGNLREQLQRRRVLGSSFGADTVSRAEAEFAQQEDEIRAESFLQELEVNNQLLSQAFEAEATGALTELERLGLETQVAANLTQSMVAARNQVNVANAEIQSAIQSDNRALIGSIGGIITESLLGGKTKKSDEE